MMKILKVIVSKKDIENPDLCCVQWWKKSKDLNYKLNSNFSLNFDDKICLEVINHSTNDTIQFPWKKIKSGKLNIENHINNTLFSHNIIEFNDIKEDKQAGYTDNNEIFKKYFDRFCS